jgi:large subunit ribosomal protein L19
MAEKKTAKTAKTTKAPKAKKASTAGETNLVRRVTVKPKNTQINTFNTGDTVNVFVKVKEGEKERTQLYKGIVTKIQGAGAAKSFTVRKISAGVGVERTFPFASPIIEKVELISTGKVRRSRLFYLRALEGKAAKIESEIVGKAATEASSATV